MLHRNIPPDRMLVDISMPLLGDFSLLERVAARLKFHLGGSPG